ncbi:hypothetical protein AQUCO_24300001v1 [Aquilegia coerulea]|uniref:non-specific serine/threonine protein kinase n=1 Tax=Aquilegia coerulea TaxID=218851 RepID=A0A2G5C0K4_AQUCA|nr:hypothetical protein AQUCO_24300001v1 [Aquilegia coerulea]
MDMKNSSRLEGTSSDSVEKCLRELGPKSYSNDDLMRFTSNFSESNKIGSGGYGEVYKGQFPDGVLVAVKVLKEMDVVEETFMAEAITMGKAYHRNLVKLYGYCFEHDMKALVYEYMENGSLDKILYESHHSNINWEKLYVIAIDTAKGLNYLHNDLDEQIIHYDIKAANVLLEKNFSAKITDFGLAKLRNRDVSRVDLTRIRGTAGSQVGCKCDVYSFGMMLFEILGKRRNGMEENWFPGQVWKAYDNGKLEQLIRVCGIPKKDYEEATILSKVALWCAQYSSKLRPSMTNVVLMLEKTIQVENPPFPFLLGQFSNSLKQSVQVIPQVYSEVYPTINESVHVNMHLPIAEDLATLIPNKGIKLPTTTLVGKTTALKYSEMVLHWIVNDEIVTIGIHGMGGVGKTTILKNVYNQLLAMQNCFEKIIWVTVSKDANVSQLQNDVAKAVDLNLSREDDMLERSRLLLQALEQRKRVVFVFDDMWQAISFVDIVCKQMRCHQDNIVRVEPLTKEESWELFVDKVNVEFLPEVRTIAVEVVKECAGLPLAIITIGGAMTGNNDLSEWRLALSNLRDSSEQNMDRENKVYKCLKFSYDWLPNEQFRKCFLYCALYPEDCRIPTSKLVGFWILDGLIEGSNRQHELDQGQLILNKLTNHCLLESDTRFNVGDCARMHDLIRDMALSITSKCFMVKAGALLTSLPNEIKWGEDLERASFLGNDIKEISISPRCPKLSTLYLQENIYLENIACDFFVNMQGLRVLDLRFNHRIKWLPDSISDLVNLRALFLNWCNNLKRVPSLAKLVQLRTLELDGTYIRELPEGIEMLVNLRCLRLTRISLRKTIPMGLISKLSKLQELYLDEMKTDKLYVVGSGTSFAEELLSLKELEYLDISFHCFSDYASYVGSPKFNCRLKRLVVKIGCRSYLMGLDIEHEEMNIMSITIDSSENDHIIQNGISILENTELLKISGFNDLTSFCNWGRLIQLREFYIQRCKEIDCIWSFLEGEKQESSSWLRCLEVMRIFKCPRLYTIFKGIPNIGILSCLRSLEIIGCDNLKTVFSSSRLLQLLQNLETIEVRRCDELKELIGGGDNKNTETPITLPKLKRLELKVLPKLKNIWRGVLICDSLKSVSVQNCSELKRLPQFKGKDQSTPPPGLITIEGSRKWWDSLEWDPAYPQNILQPFFKEKPDYVSGM